MPVPIILIALSLGTINDERHGANYLLIYLDIPSPIVFPSLQLAANSDLLIAISVNSLSRQQQQVKCCSTAS